MDKEIIDIARQLGILLKSKGIKITTAESCTGGGIAQAITEIAGSSDWFDRGFITYSNNSKTQMLGVNQKTLDDNGAVSSEVALEMVAGALESSEANLAVAVTGIAGPDGGTQEKPVGTVYIAWQLKGNFGACARKMFIGSRKEVRKQTIVFALKACMQLVK